MKFKINYPALRPLTVLFTRGSGPVSDAIVLFRYGINGLRNPALPTHALILTEDNTQLFATEETLQGLVEASLEKYTDSSNRIVAGYRWDGWNNEAYSQKAQIELATIRRKRAEESKYDTWGLLSFVPGLSRFFKPDPKKQWCSENVATLHKNYGAGFIGQRTAIAPDELMHLMAASPLCECVLDYYVKP